MTKPPQSVQNSIRRLIILIHPLLVCVAMEATAEVPRDGGAWIEELAETYQKQNGYIGVYLLDEDEIPTSEPTGWQPNFFLETGNFNISLGVASERVPPWNSALENAPLHSFDDASVTFQSDSFGLLTISRENGVLLRQTVKGSEGGVRVLELKELVQNPGRDRVVAMTLDWSTDGAEEIGSEGLAVAFASWRIFFFQAIVNAVSSEKLPLDLVEEWLRFQRDRLGEIVAPWVMAGPEHVEGAEVWEFVLNQVNNSVEDVLWDRGEELEGGDAVMRLLKHQATRELAAISHCASPPDAMRFREHRSTTAP